MKNFFKGISFSSICAGALAAVTSFLLSAKIGIAGSVIGVAAGSVVSAVATQVYKNVLKASGEKIQQAVPFSSSSETVSNERAADETQVLCSSEQDDETRIIGSSPVASDVTMVLSADTAAVAQSGLPRVISSGQEYADATRALGDIAGAGETSVFPNGQRGVSDVGVVTGKTGTLGSAHDARVQHAGQRSSNWLHSKYAPAIIAFVSALVGVGVSAGLILAFTGGQGTDTVVRDVVHEKVVPSHGNTDDYQTGDGQTPVQKPKSDSTDSNDETTTDGSDKTTNGSTDSSTSNGTSSNTNGSTSGNSGSSSDNSSNGSSQNGTDSSNGTGSNGGTSGTTGDGSSSGSGNSGTDGSTGTGTSGSTDGTTGSTGDASSN